MKKNNISLFCLGAMVISMTIISALIGCKFNLSDTKYLERPDVNVEERGFQIRGSYVNKATEYISIYRQDLHDGENARIERVAILFPKGDEDANNQTYIYKDKNVYKGHEYRYYVRFVTADGEKNRTEWSEKKTSTDGAEASAKLTYTIPTGAAYTLDTDTMTITIPADKVPTAPANTVISDISEYKDALVFEVGDVIQVFEISNPNVLRDVNLKTLLPMEFFNTDIKLLGIVGQKTVKNSKQELQSITWTDIASIPVKDTNGGVLESMNLKLEYGKSGYDYSIKSDNER